MANSTTTTTTSSSSTSSSTPEDFDRGPQILATCGSMVGLALLCVALRLFVRIRIVRSPGWDDWFMVAAAVVTFAEMMVIIPEVYYGAGRHAAYIQPASNIVTGLHLNFVTQPLCLIGLCLTKISVGLFLLRLTPSRRFQVFIWVVIGITAMSATGNLLTVFFQCTPLAYSWDTSIPGGKCISPGNLKFAAFFNSSVSFLTDVIFALLPIPMLWNVQLNWKIKVAVAGVLSLGIFASVSAIIKMTFLSSYGSHGDFLWDSADITIWTTIEICTAMLGASIPCLKPLFKAVLSGSTSLYTPNEISRKKGYYIRKNDNNEDTVPSNKSYEMYSSRRQKNTTVVRGGVRDNESEESILDASDGIRKTTRVSVSVD